MEISSGQVWKSDEGEYLFVVSVPRDIRDDTMLVVYRPTSGGEHRAVDLDGFLVDKRRVR